MLPPKRLQPAPPPPQLQSDSSPPVPSWATKNDAGLHGNTSAGRIRLMDKALSLLQIYPFRTKQQDLVTPQNQEHSHDTAAVLHNRNATVDVVVDVGIGNEPWTTIELAQAVLLVDKQQSTESSTAAAAAAAGGAAAAAAELVLLGMVSVIGTEVDVDRLRHAESVLLQMKENADMDGDDHRIMERISLRLGTTDFSLPLLMKRSSSNSSRTSPHPDSTSLLHHASDHHHEQVVVDERPVLVRVMNILRDYSVPDAIAALRKLYQQVVPGGTLVEGSAETHGRVAMALLWHRPLQTVQKDNNNTNNTESSDDEEEEIFMTAVLFGADLAALACDPEYCHSAAPDWFRRRNHLPRLYRGFFCNDCSWDQSPTWVRPMRSFLERWQAADYSVVMMASVNDDDDAYMSVTERFVRGATKLKTAQEEATSGRVGIDWADQGIVVWYPGENELVLPDVDEWFYYRQRTM